LTSNNKLFSNNQYAFIAGKSTEDAHFAANNYIRDSLDQNNKIIAIFLDIKKAFDTVKHSLLLKEFENAGIRGLAKDFFESYINNRTQTVKINNVHSKPLILIYSVLRGTVLGVRTTVIFVLY